MKQLLSYILLTLVMSCEADNNIKTKFQLITLDPGHFHAALVQKSMYDNVDSVVHVYAPQGPDLQLHLDKINLYNSAKESPTHWKEQVYTGKDFFEKMLTEKKGNVVVLSGNNERKTNYILQSLQHGFHVLADKPMVIDSEGFVQLEKAFGVAAAEQRLLYDIMTERFEITTILQRELSMLPGIFGTLEKGTPDNPAITKESIHHFYKHVSGNVLTRPAWFMDTRQQGEGIVDVMTHLVDLVQWECFPEQPIDYKKDIELLSARRWPTAMSLREFSAITKLDRFPDFLEDKVNRDSSLDIFCNGEINYRLKGVHAKTSVTWRYKAPDGTGDTHYSIMRGSKANLVIRQGTEEAYKPLLYIEPVLTDSSYSAQIPTLFNALATKYPGLSLERTKRGWKVIIPGEYHEGHEAHFSRVMKNFLLYLENKSLPAWEIPNMLAKYYTTTKALQLALNNKE